MPYWLLAEHYSFPLNPHCRDFAGINPAKSRQILGSGLKPLCHALLRVDTVPNQDSALIWQDILHNVRDN